MVFGGLGVFDAFLTHDIFSLRWVIGTEPIRKSRKNCSWSNESKTQKWPEEGEGRGKNSQIVYSFTITNS